MPELSGGLAGNVVSFSQFLKQGGIASHPAAVLDACRSLAVLDITRRHQVYLALRANFVTRKEQLEVFDRLYGLFWDQGVRLLHPEPDPSGARPQGQADPGAGGETGVAALCDPASSGGATAAERLVRKDLRHLLPEEHPATREALQVLLETLCSRPSRRTRPAGHGRQIDFPRTFRRNALFGSDLVRLMHKQPRIRKRRLVFVGDVSGSMDVYSRFFLLMAHALARREGNAAVYAFSTRLFALTEFLRDRDATRAVDRVADRVRGWSGGTRIGECLRALNRDLAQRGRARDATVVVFSDGWDRGDNATLRREIVRLKRAVRRLLWLNPLKADPGYRPLSRGMATVVPYLDGFYAANSVDCLVKVARELMERR